MKLVCMIFGHGKSRTEQDGKGAAWSVCNRCETVTGSYSFHGGKPWLQDRSK